MAFLPVSQLPGFGVWDAQPPVTLGYFAPFPISERHCGMLLSVFKQIYMNLLTELSRPEDFLWRGFLFQIKFIFQRLKLSDFVFFFGGLCRAALFIHLFHPVVKSTGINLLIISFFKN